MDQVSSWACFGWTFLDHLYLLGPLLFYYSVGRVFLGFLFCLWAPFSPRGLPFPPCWAFLLLIVMAKKSAHKSGLLSKQPSNVHSQVSHTNSWKNSAGPVNELSQASCDSSMSKEIIPLSKVLHKATCEYPSVSQTLGGEDTESESSKFQSNTDELKNQKEENGGLRVWKTLKLHG